MRASHRTFLVRLVWLALALGLLWLTLRAVSLADVWERLLHMHPARVLLLAVVNVFVVLTFSTRWWLLLFAQGYTIPYLRLVGYRLAAFSVSYFTPGPHFGGEPLQVYLVATRCQVPVSVSVTAVTLDKVLEMLANFTFLMAGVLVVVRTQTLPAALEWSLFLSGLAFFLAPVMLLGLLWKGYRPVSGLLTILDGLWRRRREIGRARITSSKFFKTTQQSETQMAELCRKRPGVMALSLALSAVSWLGIVGEFWLMTSVLGLNLTLSQALFALLAARMAILLPLPAALGALEASQVFAMSRLGLTPDAGASLGLLIRARDVIFGLVGLCVLALVLWNRKGNDREQALYAGSEE